MHPPACRTSEYTLSRQFLRGLTRPNNLVVQSFWRGKLRAFRNRVLAIGDPGFPHLAAMALNSLTHRRDVEMFSAQAKNHRPAIGGIASSLLRNGKSDVPRAMVRTFQP